MDHDSLASAHDSLLSALVGHRRQTASLLRVLDEIGSCGLPVAQCQVLGHPAEDLRTADQRLGLLVDRLRST